MKHLNNILKFKTYEGFAHKEQEIQNLYDYFLSNLDKIYKHKYFESNGNKSLVIYKNDYKFSKLVLTSHVDVVPAADSLFEPVIKDNKLYARGASDMKFAVSMYLELLNDLANDDLDFNVWLTPDEEVGGFDGIDYLLNEAKLKCDVCFLPDGGNNHSLTDCAKAVMFYKVISIGRASHGSKPWLGSNAIDTIIKFYNDLSSTTLFNGNNVENWNNTINLGKLNGGAATNVVADYAEASFDIRAIDQNNKFMIQSLINTLSEKYNLKAQCYIDGDSYKLDKDNSSVKLFKMVLAEQNIDYKEVNDHGSSDARFFTKYNIPVIMFNPMSGGDHTDNEFIDLEEFKNYYKVIKEFVYRIFKS